MERWRDIPVLPGDEIGPKVRPGVVRTGLFRDRLIVRGNPIGAVVDWIRGFCSPLPQEEVGEGDYAADGDLGTQVAPDDYGGGFAGSVAAEFPGASAVSQPLYRDQLYPDASLGVAPAAPAKRSPLEELQQARSALSEAKLRRDCAGVQQVLDAARLTRGRKNSATYAAWQGLALDAKRWLAANRRVCG